MAPDIEVVHMTTATHPIRPRGMHSRVHIDRSKGTISGILLVLLGIWGGLIPFVGPIFGYAYTPDTAWTYTSGRLFLEILPDKNRGMAIVAVDSIGIVPAMLFSVGDL